MLGQILEEFNKANTYNSVEEGNPRPYSAKESLNNWERYIQELVSLKTKIHTANVPMFKNIFILSELKSQVKYLKTLDCSSGKTRSRFIADGQSINKISEITTIDRDSLIKRFESEIERIQDELDEFNIKTQI